MSDSEVTEEDPFIAIDDSFSANASDTEDPPPAISSDSDGFRVVDDVIFPDEPDPPKTPMDLIHNSKKGRRRPPLQRRNLLAAEDLASALRVPEETDDREQKKSSETDSVRNAKESDVIPGRIVVQEVDDSFDSEAESPPSPLPSPIPVARKTPVDLFEYAVMSRLNTALVDTKQSFLEEFRELLEKALGIDHAFTGCLSDIRDGLREILNDNVMELTPMEYRGIELSAMFDQVTTLLPKGGLLRQTSASRFEDEDSEMKLKTSGFQFLDRSQALLSEMAAERTQLAQLRIQITDDDERSYERAKSLTNELEARSLAIELEKEHVDRMASAMRTRVVEERERNMSLIQESSDATAANLRVLLGSVIEGLERAKEKSTSTRVSSFVSRGKDDVEEVVVMNSQLWAKVTRLCKSLMLSDANQPVENPFERQRSDPYMRIGIPQERRTSVVANVQEKLAEIKRRREETMRGVNAIKAELAVDL